MAETLHETSSLFYVYVIANIATARVVIMKDYNLADCTAVLQFC